LRAATADFDPLEISILANRPRNEILATGTSGRFFGAAAQPILRSLAKQREQIVAVVEQQIGLVDENLRDAPAMLGRIARRRADQSPSRARAAFLKGQQQRRCLRLEADPVADRQSRERPARLED